MANTYTPLATTTVGAGGASSISFTNIPSTYTDLKFVFSSRDSRALNVSDLIINVNSKGAGANITGKYFYSSNGTKTVASTTDAIAFGSGNTLTSTFGNSELYIASYSRTGNKPIISQNGTGSTSAGQSWNLMLGGMWNNNEAITSIVFTPYTSPFLQYTTITLFGIFNSDTTSAPSTPTIGTALGLNASAAVTFTGVSNAASYTITSTPSSITAVGTSSPITITGLSNGTAYTFTVKANNPYGSSANSSASNSVTPTAGTAYDVLVGSTSSPYVNAYVFQNGWGSKYANPATLPTQTAAAVSFAPNKSALIIAEDGSSPYVSAYAWSSGFGSKYSNPASAPSGRQLGADFRTGSNAVAFGGDAPSPWVHAYPWNPGFGSKYSNPGTLGTGGFSVRYSPNGSFISSANNSASPYLTAWAWSSGFGSKYANPSTLPTGATYGQTWTPSSNAIVYSVGSSPYVVAYPWSSGYGTKYSDPATLPVGLAGRVGSFNSAGNVFVAANSNSPYIEAYAWSSGWGSKFASPAQVASGGGENALFTPDGNNIIQSGQGAPPVVAYAWSNGFAVKYSNPTSATSGIGYGLDVK